MKGKETWLALVAVVLAIGLASAAYYRDVFWQAVLIELAATALSLSVALIVVNVYLDRSARREAVAPLLSLITPSIRDHHNRLLITGFNRFGKVHFGELMDRYQNNGGDPRVLTPSERDTLYSIVKDDREYLLATVEKLELDLRELVLVLGWTFKPEILGASFACRFAIARLKNAKFDDTEESKLEACEAFLDTDIASFTVHSELVELVGLSADKVYSD